MSPKPDLLPAAPLTQAKATINDIHEISCHLQRSVRYHKARERFFENWSNLFSFASLIAGSSVVVSLLSSAPQWVALTAGALVAAMQAIEQVFRLAHKARDHSGLASEFFAIERFITLESNITQEHLREMRAEIMSIESREPPIKRYLDLICHNQVARSIGSDDIEKLKWHQRTLAQYLNGDHALQ
jgi:hypothetical protein